MPLSRKVRVLSLGALLLAPHAACQRGLQPETRPPEIIKQWIDAPLVEADAGPITGPARGVPPSTRVYRLDRLLDLFDAARFSSDRDMREHLWIGLGGGATQSGEGATRTAILRMLDEALALEDAPGLGEGEQAFLASAIRMLTSDLYRPGDADDLSAQTTAYRAIVADGHPRVIDNARWRLYDHIRGSLRGAVDAPPKRRVEIATHALYALETSIEAHLDDRRAVHVRPSFPDAEQLGQLLMQTLAPLGEDPRWQPIVASRTQADAELVQTLTAVLPASRKQLSGLATLPAGTGVEDSRGPIIWARPDEVVVDAGRPQQVRGAAGDKKVAHAFVTTVAQDGRGIILLALDDALPAPEFTAVRSLLAKAAPARLELAIAEPRIPATAGNVITGLPLDVEPTQGPGTRAGITSRVHIHLSGRGAQFRLSGAWLAEVPPFGKQLTQAIAQLRKAYPRESLVTLSFAENVAVSQVRELLQALTAGPERVFKRVVWLPNPAIVAPPVLEEATKRPGPVRKTLDRRLALAERKLAVAIDSSVELAVGDKKRIEARANGFLECLPEVQRSLAKRFTIELPMTFKGGELRSLKLGGALPGTAKGLADEAGFYACVGGQTAGLGLHEHQEQVEITVRLVSQ